MFSFIQTLASLFLSAVNFFHDRDQRKIGGQQKEIADLDETQKEAINANKQEEKIHQMSDDELDANLNRRMRD